MDDVLTLQLLLAAIGFMCGSMAAMLRADVKRAERQRSPIPPPLSRGRIVDVADFANLADLYAAEFGEN